MNPPQESTESKPRRRLRFSLRALLILMTLLAVVLGELFTYRASYVKQANALDKLSALQLAKSWGYWDDSSLLTRCIVSPGIAHTKHTLEIKSHDDFLFNQLTLISCKQIYVTDESFDDAALRQLIPLVPQLEKLVLRRSSVTNAGLEVLRSSPKLRNLSLGDLFIQNTIDKPQLRWFGFSADQFNDDALKVLATLPQLVDLRIVSKNIGDQRLKPLAVAGPMQLLLLVSPQLSDACLPSLSSHRKLESLLLGDGTFTAAGLQSLTTLSKLQTLAFHSSHLQEGALAPIAMLPALQGLSLENTGVTNEDLQALSASPKLWTLFLAGPEFDNRLLGNLAGLQNLNHLHLHGTKVNSDGIEDLLALKAINEIFVTKTQLSPAARAKLPRQWTIYDDLKPNDPPTLFFGVGHNFEIMSDHVPP